MSVVIPVRLAFNYKYPENYKLNLKTVKATDEYIVYAGKNITVIILNVYENSEGNDPVITIPLNYYENQELCERIAQYLFALLKAEELENEIDIIHYELQKEIEEYDEDTDDPEVIKEKLEELYEKIRELEDLRIKLKELNIIRLKEELNFDEENYYELVLIVR